MSGDDLPGWLPPLVRECLVDLDSQPALAALYSIIHAFGQLLRFLTIAQICDYLAEPSARTEQGNTVLGLLRRPSLGHWVKLLQVVTLSLDKRKQPVFLPELPEVLKQLQSVRCTIALLDGQKLRYVEMPPIDGLLRLRNTLAHGALPPRDDDAIVLRDAAYDALQCLFDRMKVVGDLRALRVIRRDAGETLVSLLAGNGQSLIESRLPDAVRSGTLLLERSTGEVRQLRVDLLLLNDTEAFDEPMLAFDGVSSTRAVYVGARQRIELRDQVALLRERLFAPPISVRWTATPGFLSAAAATTTTIAMLRGTKYSAETFQPRPQFRTLVQDLLDSSSGQRGLILAGESGVGKTVLLCDAAIAMMQGDDASVLPLFLTVGTLATDTDLLSAIAEAFGVGRQPDAASLLCAIESVCDGKLRGDQAPYVLLLIDGLNEFPEAETALLQFDEIVQAACAVPWLRCLASVRRGSLDLIMERLPTGSLSDSRAYLGGGQAESDVPVIMLPAFNDEEAEHAWARFRAASAAEGVLQPVSPYATLPEPVRKLVRHPLLMRLVVRTFAGRAIPPSLTGFALFRDYHGAVLSDSQRILAQDLALLFASTAKRQLSDEAIEEGLARSPGGAARWAGQADQLFDQGVLVEGEDGIAFAHQLYLEYLIERDLSEREVEFTSILEKIKELLERRSPFIEEELNALRSALFAAYDGTPKEAQSIVVAFAVEGFGATALPFVARLRQENPLRYADLLFEIRKAGTRSLEAMLNLVSTIGDLRAQEPLLEELLLRRDSAEMHLDYTLRLARVHLRFGQLSKAGYHLDRAEALVTDNQERVRYLIESAYQTVFTGGDGALALYDEALAILTSRTELTNALLVQRRSLLGGRGCAHHNLDRNEECLQDHIDALSISRMLGDRETESLDLVNIADALWACGKIDSSLAHYQDALDTASTAWFDDARDVALVGRGTVLWSAGQPDAALVSINEGIALASQLEQPWDEAWGLVYRGAILASIGKPSDGVVAILQARRIALAIKAVYLRFLCDAYLGWALELASPGASVGAALLRKQARTARNLGLRGPAAILESVAVLASIDEAGPAASIDKYATRLARNIGSQASWKGSWEYLGATIAARYHDVHGEPLGGAFRRYLDEHIAQRRARMPAEFIAGHRQLLDKLGEEQDRIGA